MQCLENKHTGNYWNMSWGGAVEVYSPVDTGDKVEFNMVDFVESRLLPKPATKSTVTDAVNFVANFGNKSATIEFDSLSRSISLPIRLTLLLIQSTLLPVLAKNQQQREFDSLLQWTLLPIRSTLLPVCTGPKQHGRLRRLSTKLTVLNSTLLPVCTGLKRLQKYMYMGQKCQINDSMLKQRWQNLTAVSFCLLSPLIIDI